MKTIKKEKITKFDLKNKMPNLGYQNLIENFCCKSTKWWMFVKPHFKSLPHAKASIVSRGKLILEMKESMSIN